MSAVEQFFKDNEDLYLVGSKDVKGRQTARNDLHVMMVLDELLYDDAYSDRDMVSHVRHEEMFFAVDADRVFELASEEKLQNLIRCGLRYSDGSLCMFV
jgi:hypothetical protein